MVGSIFDVAALQGYAVAIAGGEPLPFNLTQQIRNTTAKITMPMTAAITGNGRV